MPPELVTEWPTTVVGLIGCALLTLGAITMAALKMRRPAEDKVVTKSWCELVSGNIVARIDRLEDSMKEGFARVEGLIGRLPK